MNQTIRQITRACLLTLAIAPFASSPAAPKIGVYPTLNGGSTGTTGYTAATKTADYETWLARPMDYVVQFVPVKTFAGNTETTIPSLTGTNWFFSQCAAFPTSFRSRMVLSVPMLPDDPSTTLAIGAAATNN